MDNGEITSQQSIYLNTAKTYESGMQTRPDLFVDLQHSYYKCRCDNIAHPWADPIDPQANIVE
jgi:hypothetical protein